VVKNKHILQKSGTLIKLIEIFYRDIILKDEGAEIIGKEPI